MRADESRHYAPDLVQLDAVLLKRGSLQVTQVSYPLGTPLPVASATPSPGKAATPESVPRWSLLSPQTSERCPLTAICRTMTPSSGWPRKSKHDAGVMEGVTVTPLRCVSRKTKDPFQGNENSLTESSERATPAA